MVCWPYRVIRYQTTHNKIYLIRLIKITTARRKVRAESLSPFLSPILLAKFVSCNPINDAFSSYYSILISSNQSTFSSYYYNPIQYHNIICIHTQCSRLILLCQIQKPSNLFFVAWHASCSKRNTVSSLDYPAEGTCKTLITLFNPAKYGCFSLLSLWVKSLATSTVEI